MSGLAAFKSYDVRGKVPSELNEELAYRIGAAYARVLQPRIVAVGHDIRLSSPALSHAVARGLMQGGCDVLELGLCGTEEVYFATFRRQLDGGIMVTASHNPADYNGMKLVGRAASPIGRNNGLDEIERVAQSGASGPGGGSSQRIDLREEYLNAILAGFDVDRLKGFRMVANPGHGGAGLLAQRLAERVGWELEVIQGEPDGTFPHGVPNPLLPENREATAQAVRERRAQLGVSWDGDFDRCFFFDETGEFVDGYYLVGLLASRFPGRLILHDPRLVWNTVELVRAHGGEPRQIPTGHVFFKQYMQETGAVYGGEMSAHHYFQSFGGCDSGMLPWLTLLDLLAQRGEPLSALVAGPRRRYPISGEINRSVRDARAAMAHVEGAFPGGQVDRMDGLSLEFPEWRFNLRASNTEPLLRLNVETRGDAALLEARTQELLKLIAECS